MQKVPNNFLANLHIRGNEINELHLRLPYLLLHSTLYWFQKQQKKFWPRAHPFQIVSGINVD